MKKTWIVCSYRTSRDEIAIDFSDGKTLSVILNTNGYSIGRGNELKLLGGICAVEDLYKDEIDSIISEFFTNSGVMRLEFEDAANPQAGKLDPPALAEFLLMLFTPKRRAKCLIGDLEEQFARKCEELGRDRAVRWYWAETLRSLWPLLRLKARKAIKSAAVIRYFKRLFRAISGQ